MNRSQSYLPWSPALLLAACLLALPTGAQRLAGQAVRAEARPASLDLRVGDDAPLAVVALDAEGREVTLPFRAAAPRGALRVRNGRITALEAGDFMVTFTSAGENGAPVLTVEVPVTVRWPAIARVDVSPRSERLLAGTVVPHRVRAFHADGTERPHPEVTWSVSDSERATVDRWGNLEGRAPGSVQIHADVEGARGSYDWTVEAFTGTALSLSQPPAGLATGDVVRFEAHVRDGAGTEVQDVPVQWSLSHEPAPDVIASAAGGQIDGGVFVADAPGVYTVTAGAGHLVERVRFEVEPRDVVQELNVLGTGSNSRVRTTDLWVFEGNDGRDYAIAGSKMSGGHAFVWDVTDPSNPVKTDSVQVDARAVNDVKVSPDARYATMTREGASDRRNGVVILDLANPAHPVIASEVTDRLTGGVHNAFPLERYAYALSNGDKYVILDMTDIYAPQIVGEYDHPESRVHDVWVHDGIAYSAEWETGLVAVDVGNGAWGGTPEAPVFISSLPLPTGGTHAAFPYASESTDRFYVFVGDEIMSRRGLAWSGYDRSMGSYALPYDPDTGTNGIPLTTQGYIQVIDFTDPENPEMVARYEVSEYGTHNIWVEDDVLYQAYYEGGVRVVDVSGELRGNLYTQGREIAVFKPADPQGFVANSPMVWSAMPHKGHIFFSDTNSGLWTAKLVPKRAPVSE